MAVTEITARRPGAGGPNERAAATLAAGFTPWLARALGLQALLATPRLPSLPDGGGPGCAGGDEDTAPQELRARIADCVGADAVRLLVPGSRPFVAQPAAYPGALAAYEAAAAAQPMVLAEPATETALEALLCWASQADVPVWAAEVGAARLASAAPSGIAVSLRTLADPARVDGLSGLLHAPSGLAQRAAAEAARAHGWELPGGPVDPSSTLLAWLASGDGADLNLTPGLGGARAAAVVSAEIASADGRRALSGPQAAAWLAVMGAPEPQAYGPQRPPAVPLRLTVRLTRTAELRHARGFRFETFAAASAALRRLAQTAPVFETATVFDDADWRHLRAIDAGLRPGPFSRLAERARMAAEPFGDAQAHMRLDFAGETALTRQNAQYAAGLMRRFGGRPAPDIVEISQCAVQAEATARETALANAAGYVSAERELAWSDVDRVRDRALRVLAGAARAPGAPPGARAYLTTRLVRATSSHARLRIGVLFARDLQDPWRQWRTLESALREGLR